MPYFFGSSEGGRVTLSGADARHLARSLRARPGDMISVLDPVGKLLEVKLEEVAADRVSGRVMSEREHDVEPSLRVIVALALLPAPAIEDALAHCTEVGASAFVLLAARRSVVRAREVVEGRRDRWNRICREASMLAGRLHVPEITGPLDLVAVLTRHPNAVVLHRAGEVLGRPGPKGITLVVGPEGGWSEEELEVAGPGRLASLGLRNLRAETAAAAGVAAALALASMAPPGVTGRR